MASFVCTSVPRLKMSMQNLKVYFPTVNHHGTDLHQAPLPMHSFTSVQYTWSASVFLFFLNHVPPLAWTAFESVCPAVKCRLHTGTCVWNYWTPLKMLKREIISSIQHWCGQKYEGVFPQQQQGHHASTHADKSAVVPMWKWFEAILLIWHCRISLCHLWRITHPPAIMSLPAPFLIEGLSKLYGHPLKFELYLGALEQKTQKNPLAIFP